MLVELDEVCDYLYQIAANHTTKHTRTHTKAHGKSEEMVAFVLRRCAEALMIEYRTRGAPGGPTVDQTFNNRANM